MAGYSHNEIDAKWQDRWAERDTFATPTDRAKPKYYATKVAY